MANKVISNRREPNVAVAFNAQRFLDSAGVARKVAEFAGKKTIFSQGEPARTVRYIQKGSVRLSIVSETGKQAVVAISPTT
jgi:CRP-like cAMP-binding protein